MSERYIMLRFNNITSNYYESVGKPLYFPVVLAALVMFKYHKNKLNRNVQPIWYFCFKKKSLPQNYTNAIWVFILYLGPQSFEVYSA